MTPDTLDLLNLLLSRLKESHDTLQIKAFEPIPIQQVNTNNFSYDFWIPTIATIIATTLLLWEKFKWPRIAGKIISLTTSSGGTYTGTDLNGRPTSINGLKYFLKISINVIRQNVYYKDLKVFVKYPNDRKKYEGIIYWAEKDEWILEGKAKRLVIPSDKFLWFNNILEKDKVLFFYLSFFIEKSNLETFEEIELVFISPKDKKFKMEKLQSRDINSFTILFEKNLWQ